MVTVKEAAAQLGVSERRVRQRITAGALPAEKVGRDWVVQLRPGVLRRPAGRPLSPRSAWDVVALSIGACEGMTATRRARARRRLDDLRRDDPAGMAGALAPRARRLELVAAGVDLPDLRADPRLAPSGLSSPLSQMEQPDLLEAYVEADVVESLTTQFLLRAATAARRPNLVLHVVPVADVLHLVGSPVVVACDLVEHGTPRDLQVAREVLGGAW